MVRIRSSSELIDNALDFYRTAQPQLDTKPGTVSRDILIEGPNTQLSLVYQELSSIRNSQSIRLALSTDLDRLGANYGLTRKQGQTSSGVALLTFNAIDADIPINTGDLVTANNGASFRVVQGITVSVVQVNQYRAIAQKYSYDLAFVGINDQFAVEVRVESSGVGILGNISKYALTASTTPGVSNVTNTSPFSGGTAVETDQAFRNRILSVFSGANTGTALGYRNAVLADPQVIDAVVVEPGDPLMTRDGTVVSVLPDGTRVILSEGTGGKVDIYVQGVRFVEILDSYIYRDKSNQDNPTNSKNDFVLGQIPGEEAYTVSRKRLVDLQNEILPDQPVNNIVEVSGSRSGSNFTERAVDSLGRITGNYQLIRDTGAYGGSPWGYDRLHWIDNEIRDFREDQTKGRFNGQDALSFPDVTRIGTITQDVLVTNENGRVSPTNRASIQLAHMPIKSVTRVLNVNTGERYVISSQNPDGTGAINYTGRILITGATLPAISDILQVDYTWIFDYDQNFDYDNRLTNDNPRSAVDSVDWGFSNAVSREESIVAAAGSLLNVSVTHPVSTVINVNTFASDAGTVQLLSGRLGVVVSTAITNVVSVVRDSDQAQLFTTSKNDGSFSGLTIFLPTDTVAQIGDSVSAVYNANDVFSVDGVNGSFDGTLITLPANSGTTAGTIVEVSYIANIRTLLPQTLLSQLPALKNGNGFTTSSIALFGTQPTTNVYSGTTIVQNLRKAPSRLQMSISGTIVPGTLTVSGTSFSRIANVVFTVSNNGLVQNLSSVIKSYLKLLTSASVPSNVNVVRVISVEKVRTTNSLEVLEVEHEYDIEGYKIRDNSFVKSESIQDTDLTPTEFALPDTPDNNDNLPSLGDRLRVTFFIDTVGDTENVSFSKSGILSTQKVFATIDSIGISSGFSSTASQNATLTVSNMNQSASGNRYAVFYDYIAPKSNERISIRYNKNAVIDSGTFAVEAVRPISADVLVKAATAILIDVELSIVVTSGFTNSTSIVKQNVADAITAALNAGSLGTTLDQSDLINVCYTVAGVDRVRIISFNEADEAGSVLSITAQKNQYLQSGFVKVNIESR